MGFRRADFHLFRYLLGRIPWDMVLKRGSGMLVESCLTCLVAFCDETTGLVGEGRALDVFYLNFNKASDTIIMSSDKLLKYRLDKWTVLWI